MSDPKTAGAGEQIRAVIKAFDKAYPGMIDLVNQNIGPTAQAQLASDTATAPGYAKLQSDIFKDYAPGINATGSEINRQNQLAQAGTDLAVLQGPGRQLASESLATAKIADPEYYKTRELGSNKLGELFGSLDVSPGLSESERREIEGSLARDNFARGNETPTPLSTVENAVQFGSAGANRMAQKQDQFGKALAQVTSFLPTAKSGTDTFLQATGRASTPNTGQQFLQPAATGTGSNAWNLASNVLGQAGTLQNTSMTANANRSPAAVNVLGSLPDY